jgi:hypothetical protein
MSRSQKLTKINFSRFLESHVNASLTESFHLLFDYLEWTEGEKLSACCHTPGRQPIELYCPFETSTNETDIQWQSERIKCEPETTRVGFFEFFRFLRL